MNDTQHWIDPNIPTLVIGLGGTGAEVLRRCKWQLLARNWGSETEPVRLNSLRDLPFVKFLLLDTDGDRTFVTGVNICENPCSQTTGVALFT